MMNGICPWSAILVIVCLTGRAAAAAEPEFFIGEGTPSYSLELRTPQTDYNLTLILKADVRNLALTFRLPDTFPVPSKANVLVEVTLKEPPKPGEQRLAFSRRIVEGMDPIGAGPRTLTVTLRPPPGRSTDSAWTIRLTSVPEKPSTRALPLTLSLSVQADARRLTAREEELIKWRAGINPSTDPEAVRGKIRELSDAEVRHYTGYKDRENFLRLWRRESIEDQPKADDGTIRVTEENRGLFVQGSPLPNGHFLHH